MTDTIIRFAFGAFFAFGALCTVIFLALMVKDKA